MSWETRGTVTVTNNSTVVTGLSTLFVSKSRVGDAFVGPDMGLYEITNIASDTVLSISPPYAGVTVAGAAYKIAPLQGYLKLSADRLFSITNTLGGTVAVVDGLPGWLKNNTPAPVTSGGTGAETASAARQNLGLKAAALLEVGSSAGTVAAGNDSRIVGAAAESSVASRLSTKVETTDTRLSDSREWKEPTATQAEAEAGTETTRRAFTAQRVRQAIVAWWSSLGSVTPVANKVPIANGDGKISTSWLKTDVSTDPLSVTDVVLTRGAHGIGEMGNPSILIPGGLLYNAYLGGNTLVINSTGPYTSFLTMQENGALLGSSKDGVAWNATIITDKNQVVLGETPATARAALDLTGEWVDLRPHLKPGFYWNTTREGRNSPPRIRKLSCGRVELDGIVSFNETSGPTPIGVFINVPAPFRPPLTSGGLIFADAVVPLAFGSCSWIVTGEVEYNPPRVHGDVMLIPLTLPATSQNGAISINGIYWFT